MIQYYYNFVTNQRRQIHDLGQQQQYKSYQVSPFFLFFFFLQDSMWKYTTQSFQNDFPLSTDFTA